MKACENHNGSIVIFEEAVCPLCRAEKKLKTIKEDVQKSMMIMRQIQRPAEEAGGKSD
jgi:hypothetical protein